MCRNRQGKNYANRWTVMDGVRLHSPGIYFQGWTPFSHFLGQCSLDGIHCGKLVQESRAAERKPHDAEAILFGLKFTNDKAMLQSSKHIGALCSSSMRCTTEMYGVPCHNVGPMTSSLSILNRVLLCKPN